MPLRRKRNNLSTFISTIRNSCDERQKIKLFWLVESSCLFEVSLCYHQESETSVLEFEFGSRQASSQAVIWTVSDWAFKGQIQLITRLTLVQSVLWDRLKPNLSDRSPGEAVGPRRRLLLVFTEKDFFLGG